MVCRFIQTNSLMEVLSAASRCMSRYIYHVLCAWLRTCSSCFIYVLFLETIRGVLCNSVFVMGDVRRPLITFRVLNLNLVLCRSTFFLNIHWCAIRVFRELPPVEPLVGIWTRLGERGASSN